MLTSSLAYKSFARFGFPLRRHGALALVLAVYWIFRAGYWHDLQVWDGMAYYELLQAAIRRPFTADSWYLAGHSSIIFFPLAAVPGWLFPGRYLPFQIWMTFLASLMLVCFYSLLGELARDRSSHSSRVERALLTAVLAFHPSVAVNLIQFTVDEGVFLFFIPYWYCLLRSKIGWAAVFALSMVFSKASGLFLLPIPWIQATLAAPRGEQLEWWSKRWVALGLVVSVLFLYCVIRTGIAHKAAFYPGQTLTAESLWTGASAAQIRTVLAQVGVLSFSWIPSLLILLGLGKGLRARRINGELAGFALSLGALLFLETRYLPFTNLRYVLPVLPIFLLTAWTASRELLPKTGIRLGVWCAVLLLVSTSNSRTWDPVSKAVFGTFPFGDHSLLRMTRWTQECCGPYGRDQLLYSPEVLRGFRVLDTFLSQEQPWGEALLVLPETSNFMHETPEHLLLGRRDFRTGRRTLDQVDAGKFNFTGTWAFMSRATHPPQAYWIEIPVVDSGPPPFLKDYPERRAREYENEGFRIRVTSLRRR